jgi:pSer/pThr/pTyr-binding forkhead associated (FHA) protein
LSVVDTLIESELRSTSNLNTIVLQVTYRDGIQEEISFKQRVVYIGRASSFGQFDQDPEISRKHLLIKLNDNGEVFIEDQGSTNGSRLNGQRITGMHLVRPKDLIRVGGTTLRVTAMAS